MTDLTELPTDELRARAKAELSGEELERAIEILESRGVIDPDAPTVWERHPRTAMEARGF